LAVQTIQHSGRDRYGHSSGILTIFVELPFLENTYGGDYRNQNDVNSNRFHPSSAHRRDLIRNSFIPMAQQLIYQSRAPGCPTLNDRPLPGGCPTHDFGLAGAKISSSALGVGQVESGSGALRW
jgi:hypothetical protein